MTVLLILVPRLVKGVFQEDAVIYNNKNEKFPFLLHNIMYVIKLRSIHWPTSQCELNLHQNVYDILHTVTVSDYLNLSYDYL